MLSASLIIRTERKTQSRRIGKYLVWEKGLYLVAGYAVIIIKVINTIKEKPGTLHWETRAGTLKARPHPLKAPGYKNTNTFKSREPRSA